MNTMQADLSATLEHFRTDMEKRDKDNTRWQIGLWMATIVVLGILVRWPNSPIEATHEHQDQERGNEQAGFTDLIYSAVSEGPQIGKRKI